ncbi:DcaP family trimeric outer membrane transporter [Methylomonas sp. ZR1]|uniref:DcaP family trimeric outer membrane transporter n=1 Tax=Methylomonas sp. ZR1 TaxID=1797072 RepID=UPI001492A944|nr:DcaP family trimeric outer membrane transporter [Methylomonas sp. ZR1]NOV28219.1 porin [Methylomonas sp. ZR1]
MSKFLQLCLMWLYCWIVNPAQAADEDIKALLKALSQQVTQLQSQVERSNARIEQLEQELQHVRAEQVAAGKAPVSNTVQAVAASPTTVATGSTGSALVSDKAKEKPAVTVGDVKGTFKIPGTDTSVGLGGFVKMDTLFNSVSAGRDRLGDQQLAMAQIPVGAAGERGQITFHGKESRLWFKSFTPTTDWGDINTYIEFDFYGDPATYTYTPRLRHAYGSIGHFLAGQTWTTFLNVSALPDTLDVGGSAGAVASLRDPLVRWSEPFNWLDTPMEWQLALEAPRSRLWVDSALEPSSSKSTNPNLDAGYYTTPNADRYPDLMARLNLNPDWGNVSLAAVGRQLRYSNGSTGYRQAEWGGGVNLAGRISTFGLDNMRFMAHYGKGDGRYVSTNNTFADAALDQHGAIELVNAYGGMLSYQHWWDKQWRSNVTYGFAQADYPSYANTVLSRQVQSVHANLLWSPVSQAMFGVEYTYATRELIDGRDGVLQRVQFSAKYSF